MAGARLAQEQLPSLAERASSAQARAGASARYFAGELSLVVAFPDLEGAPLDDAAWLGAQQARLASRAEAREATRVESAPDGLSEAEKAKWRAARDAALAAEEQADLGRGRLLAGLKAGLTRAPALSRRSIALQLSTWSEARRAADELPEDPAAAEAAQGLVAAAGEAEGRLRRLQAAGWRAMTVPGDGALEALVLEDLALLDAAGSVVPPLGSPEALSLDATVDRLERVRPLLSGEAAAGIDAARDGVALALVQAEISDLDARLASVKTPELDSLEAVDAALARATEAEELALALAATRSRAFSAAASASRAMSAR